MRAVAAIVSLVVVAGLTQPAAGERHACLSGVGSADAACNLVAWQIAARGAERPREAHSDDEKACAGLGSGGFSDWISACDRLIASGRLDAARLTTTYRHRGNWHQLRRDHARAVADYDEVLRRDPRNVLAANSRKASLRAICFGTDTPEARLAACTRIIDDLAANDADRWTPYPVPARLY